MTKRKPAESLSARAERAKEKHQAELIDIFHELKGQDPEVATEALSLWDDLGDAAEFIVVPSKALSGKTPLQAIEAGNRQEVLDIIGRIKFGVCL